jgi:hypothetical protein
VDTITDTNVVLDILKENRDNYKLSLQWRGVDRHNVYDNEMIFKSLNWLVKAPPLMGHSFYLQMTP